MLIQTVQTAQTAPTELIDSEAWRQVLLRDPAADGCFVYAVTSTGIFCRPTCPSRRPDPKNVRFYTDGAAATAAGFRSCKRCAPEGPTPPPNPQADLVQAALRYMAEHSADTRLRLADLSRAIGAPRLTVRRAFERTLGATPAQIARTQRFERFGAQLRAPSAPTVTRALYDAGFGSSSRLYEQGTARLGMTPTDLRRGAPNLTIRYTIADSPLGRTLVAATPTGICAITFAEVDADLRSDLRTRFPKANLLEIPAATTSSNQAPDRTEAWLAEAVHFVLAHLSEHPTAQTFPLDIRATAFQLRVWQALQAIPRGQTLSYSNLARELGQPTATRAVASACAANPVALAIPCHRVVGRNGALTGYRWGVARKKQILETEQSTYGEVCSGLPQQAGTVRS